MPSAIPTAKGAAAVAAKHADLAAQYRAHKAEVVELQRQAIAELVPSVSDELELQEEGRARARAFLEDKVTIFRFYRRSRYSVPAALTLLNTTLLWRLRTDLDLLSLSSLHPLYVTPPAPNPPLFFVHSKWRDIYGRPCGLISLRSVERTAERTLEELKEFIIACMEINRRYIGDLYARAESKLEGAEGVEDAERSLPLQMVIAIDLAGSGMANLELELLPFLLDLLKNHFPGMVGAVYILHYGWIHSGMWAVAKRVLPEQALARIFFPSTSELLEHFKPGCLPSLFGGELDVPIESGSSDVFKRYGKPRLASSAPGSPVAAPSGERRLSRQGSFESIYEVFYSASGTPWASRSMTPRHSGRSTPRGDVSPATFSLNLTPSAARKLRHLQMTRGELFNAAEAEDERSGRLRPSRDNALGLAGTSRPRSASDPKRGQRETLLGLPSSAQMSPMVSPHDLSPTASTSRHARTRSSSTLLANVAPPRQVRFDSHSRRRSQSPARRVNSLRDFRLHLPSDDGNPLDVQDSSTPSEAGSDASGNVGERLVATPTTGSLPNASGFFARWRKGKQRAEEVATGEDEKVYKNDLWAQQHGQASFVVSSPQSAGVGELTNEDARDEDVQVAMTPDDPGSPQLQVPHIADPPLAGDAQLQAPPFLSHRSRKYGGPGHVSPYSFANPYWGYPAYVTTPSGGVPGGPGTSTRGLELGFGFSTPRHLHARRRKRDLLRTLSYLFVLRILAAHRQVRWRAALVWREVARTFAATGDEDDDLWRAAEERHRRLKSKSQSQSQSQAQSGSGLGSHRNEDRPSTLQPPGRPTIPARIRFRYLYLLLAIILMRAEWRHALLNGLWGALDGARALAVVGAGRTALKASVSGNGNGNANVSGSTNATNPVLGAGGARENK